MTYLSELLKRYPRFYDRRPSSNNYKYHEVSGEGYLNLKRNIRKVELARRIARPIKIWKSQILPHQYSIDYSVELEDLKRVQLYLDPSTLVADSGELPLGTHEFTNSYGVEEAVEIIPTTKYYVKVEDWDENIYYKGIPENDDVLGDKYDRESILDVYGNNLGIERRTYVEPDSLDPEDYPNTIPPYCNTQYESDKFYEERILRYMDDLEEKNLPSVEIKRLFEVEPAIEGRWRHIVKMDRDVMVDSDLNPKGKYMATDEWNRSVFDIGVDLDSMPPNIPIATGPEVQKVLDKTVPLSKKAYFSMIGKYYVGDMEIGEDPTIVSFNTLYEDYNLAMLVGKDNPMLVEGCVGSGELLGGFESELLYENYLFRTDPRADNPVLSEGLDYYQFDTKYYASSISEFNAGTHTNTWAFTYEGQDYVRAVTRNLSQGWRSASSNSQTSEHPGSWVNPQNMCDIDSDESYHNVDTYEYSERINLTNWGFNIPSNAIVQGVYVHISRRQSGTVNFYDHRVQLVYGPDLIGTNKAATGTKWPQTATAKAYGGSTDSWGTSLTPAKINHSSFGLAIQGHNNSGWDITVYIGYVAMTVYYSLVDGYFTSQTISYDPLAIGWDKLYLGQIWNPINTMWVNVLRASDNAVLLESLPYNTIDLSEIQHTNLKVRVGFRTNDLSKNPSLGSITVKNKKQVYY